MHVFWQFDFKWILGGSWRALGPILEGFGRLPCASWTALGRSCGAPGRFGLPLFGSWGVSWALLVGLVDFLGSFSFPGTPQASILEGSGTCWARFWKAPGECFGMPFSAPRTSLRNALINAVTTLFHSPALFCSSRVVRRSECSTSAASNGVPRAGCQPRSVKYPRENPF